MSDKKLSLIARGSGSELLVYGDESSRVVLKTVSSSSRREQCHLRNQYRFLREVDHQHIIRALRYQERVESMGNKMDKQSTTKNILVLEYAHCGSLLHYLHAQQPSLPQKRAFFRDIAEAVEYLHAKGIAHRDLKLQNILVFKQQDGEVSVKVSDFGFASKFQQNGENLTFTEFKGTRKGYMAPEIHKCQNTKEQPYQAEKTDIFALGVVLFALVVGNLPFQQATPENRLYNLINDKKYDQFWKSHPKINSLENEEGFRVQEFKDVFQQMVSMDPKERPSAKEVLKFSWII